MSKVPVRVYIRVRPLLEHEVVHSSEVCVRVEGEDQLVLGVDKTFRFDRVFPPSASQAVVYECGVEPLVRACVEGYNATVFAYGQTGSGKSFTMGSELEWRAEEERGVIPRALDDLFQQLPSNTTSSVCVSYIEIYKDELRDLLVGVASDGGGMASERGGVVIREDSQGNTVVLGCTTVVVTSAEEALGWLEVGNSSRVTGATHMNHRSSRSHAIFTVHIEQKWVESAEGGGDDPVVKSSSTLDGGDLEQCLSAKFHFVDLAGSERVSKTGNQGERFKESVHINSGLLALGNVISALGGSKKRYPHIPYRDSKITRLLKDSLGGNARTVMITCLSPAAVNLTESLNSLKYAKRARNIHNRPVVNRDPQSSQLLAMQAEIQSLREELLKAQSTHSLPTDPPSTVQSSLTTQPSEMLSRVSDLEQELSRARLQCEHYQTSLSQARDRVARLLSGASEGVCSVEQTQELLEWMESLKTLPGHDEPPPISSSPLSTKALQTIDLLRSELERCHADLQTDEELFAEKLDEIAELQCSYNEVAAEKERLETMWLAAQQSEGLLRAELEKVLEQLQNVEKELADREEVIEQQKDSLSSHKGEESLVNEQELPHEVREIPVAGGDEGVDDHREFLANRSLIVGKVSTSILEDFTEENVLKSLSTLTQILVANQNTGEDLGRTWTCPQTHPHSSTHPLTKTDSKSTSKENPSDKRPTSTEQGSSNATTKKVSTGDGGSKVIKKPPKFESLKVQSVDSEDVSGRPTTPVGMSTKEPSFSRVGRSESCEAGEGVSEMDVLNESAVESRRQLTAAEEKLTSAQDELRNLNLKIRLKEELIRELVKTGKTTKQLNSTYLTKIQSLEREVLTVTKELGKTQSSLQRASQREVTPDLRKALDEQRKKLAGTEKKLATLQKKQKETQRLVQFGARREHRVDELEGEVERLRNQQDSLKRRLKTQADRKIRLESDLQKYQHRIEVLQTHSDQQSKVLRVKTEEAAVAQKKLRRMSAKRLNMEPVSESSESVWLDQEVTRILERKQAIQALEKELAERERVVQEREALITERDALAFRQLQASQATARDIVHLSLQIDSIESSLKRKEESLSQSSKTSVSDKNRQDVEALSKERDELVRKCSELQQKMEDDSFLPDEEQRTLCELNEQIEILEAALDFKNQSIDSRQPGLNQVLQQDVSTGLQMKSKLEQLSPPDLHNLLLRYVDRVVELQMADHQSRQSRRELEVRLTEQEREVGRLERSLKQATAAGERQTLVLQKEHEQQVQLLVKQLADVQQSAHNTSQTQILRDKVKQLEKDLYYYKKTSRDLRKKLKEDGGRSSSATHLSLHSVGSSATNELNADSAVKDSIETSATAVNDSLFSVRSGALSVKGSESRTTTKSGGLNVVTLKLEAGKGSDGSDLDTGKTGDVKPSSKVVRRSKKQLRQLSVSEVTERKSLKDKPTNKD